ncbi:parB-like nuclease domain protein [Mycobacterium kansasii]|uniref:ParB-like nuclease domain protein n=1 Tax=Mycobacterium kansasii TaxID=1768 RepID=A0A1V3WE90_MYCKA|nr:parB-like nuclease domain protein [Mycobacterium kansasii]
MHKDSLRVVDGVHRLRVAQLKGRREIDVVLFDGSEQEAFALSVLLNVSQGLPLAWDDRKSAAVRILLSNPDWSDRVIASLVGLSHKTIANLRRCSTGENRQLNGRIGRDGKARPTNPVEGRLRAAELLGQRPDLSLRELARAADISVSTARDVRLRLDSGEHPVPDRLRTDRGGAPAPVALSSSPSSGSTALADEHGRRCGRESALGVSSGPKASRPSGRTAVSFDLVLERLKRDPAVRFNEAGRSLVRQLVVGRVAVTNCQQVLSFAPAHCLATVAELAHSQAAAWQQLAAMADATAEMQHAL